MGDVDLQIGIIGLGDMGKLYALRLRKAGWQFLCYYSYFSVNACDREECFDETRESMKDTGVHLFKDGHGVSRASDLIIYSVEAAAMDRVVAAYGPSTKMGAIVSGQTSVKAPEREAFERYLPNDTAIISCHSLHGPKVDPTGQPLVLIKHRASEEQLKVVETVLSCLRSRYVYLSYEEHDIVTANTQAATHAAFMAMGTAWRCSNDYPWETGRYPGGVETVKINLMLRIYSSKWHVYAGLALLNPAARTQVTQYATSATALFKLMIAEREADLVERVFAARRGVFGWADDELGAGGKTVHASHQARNPILMSDTLLDQFHLVARKTSLHSGDPTTVEEPSQGDPPNSHLSLLAVVDSWHTLRIDPYAHLDLAATPLFRLWIGVCEYLFRSPERLRAACRAGVLGRDFRSDDTEFVVAARGWAQAVQFQNFDLYRWRFEDTSKFFEPRFEESSKVGAEMLKAVAVEQL